MGNDREVLLGLSCGASRVARPASLVLSHVIRDA